MALWNVVAMVCLATPSYVLIRACIEMMSTPGTTQPYLYLGIITLIALAYCVLICNVIYFREERKKD